LINDQPTHSTESAWPFVVALATLTLVSALGRAVLAVRGLPLPEETGRLDSFVFNLVLALWVRSDRRSHNFSIAFEFDAFMFFAWPFLLPWYLYQTRGPRGLLYAAATCGLAILPHFIATIAASLGAIRSPVVCTKPGRHPTRLMAVGLLHRARLDEASATSEKSLPVTQDQPFRNYRGNETRHRFDCFFFLIRPKYEKRFEWTAVKSRNVIFNLNVSIVTQLKNQLLFLGTHWRKVPRSKTWAREPPSDAETRLRKSLIQDSHPIFLANTPAAVIPQIRHNSLSEISSHSL